MVRAASLLRALRTAGHARRWPSGHRALLDLLRPARRCVYLATVAKYSAGAAATLACIRVLSVLAQEPGHPQQVEVVLFALGCCLSLSGSPWARFLLGLVGAALVFTKINVGAFYLVAMGCALVCLLPARRLRSAGMSLLIAYAALAAPLLAHRHLGSRAAGFCVVASLCTTVTFTWASKARPDVPLGLREMWIAVAGALAGSVLIVAVTTWQGVSPAALINGVLLEAARIPGVLFLGFRLGLVPVLFAVGVLAALALSNGIAAVRRHSGTLRAIVGLGAIFLLIRTDLTWVVPFLPLALIPPSGREWTLAEWFPRIFVTALAAAEFLQTYPVAGGQAGIAALPWSCGHSSACPTGSTRCPGLPAFETEAL